MKIIPDNSGKRPSLCRDTPLTKVRGKRMDMGFQLMLVCSSLLPTLHFTAIFSFRTPVL